MIYNRNRISFLYNGFMVLSLITVVLLRDRVVHGESNSIVPTNSSNMPPLLDQLFLSGMSASVLTSRNLCYSSTGFLDVHIGASIYNDSKIGGWSVGMGYKPRILSWIGLTLSCSSTSTPIVQAVSVSSMAIF